MTKENENISHPWYKEPMVWLAISIPLSAVIYGIFFLTVSITSFDGMVVDDYYKNGLAINRQLEKKERAAEQGISAKFDFTGGRVTVIVAGPVSAERLQLLLSHPLESDRDFKVMLVQSMPGEYRGRLQAEVAPRWHWALLNNGEQPWRLDGSVSAADLR
jgi:hypothetical protein